ncbi:MAG: Uma2 family endonuclease [Nitrospirae bacterium]|nr:Uma2 family endonuclease [Nitrospirota bacterium]
MFMNATIGIEKDFDLTEIINGEEVMTHSPFRKHQRIAVKIFRQLDRFVEHNKLGFVYFSPLDVIFEEGENRLQPDIFFVRNENEGIEQDWIRGVPDMVCEIISPGTLNRDVYIKKEIYEKYGVPEYWVIFPDFMAIEILTLESGEYVRYSFAEVEGMVTSKVIDGLQVNVKDIFE